MATAKHRLMLVPQPPTNGNNRLKAIASAAAVIITMLVLFAGAVSKVASLEATQSEMNRRLDQVETRLDRMEIHMIQLIKATGGTP